MAAKRYDPPKPRTSIRRTRSIKAPSGSGGPSAAKLPRATSAVPMDNDEEGIVMQNGAAAPPGPPIGLPHTGSSLSGYPPHEMRYFTYKHARWSLRVRKEVTFTLFYRFLLVTLDGAQIIKT